MPAEHLKVFFSFLPFCLHDQMKSRVCSVSLKLLMQMLGALTIKIFNLKEKGKKYIITLPALKG
jgi:hypothetical protein